ncbi:MAG: hypothetical protein AAF944_06145 [Bacteroidota bacterium]
MNFAIITLNYFKYMVTFENKKCRCYEEKNFNSDNGRYDLFPDGLLHTDVPNVCGKADGEASEANREAVRKFVGESFLKQRTEQCMNKQPVGCFFCL